MTSQKNLMMITLSVRIETGKEPSALELLHYLAVMAVAEIRKRQLVLRC